MKIDPNDKQPSSNVYRLIGYKPSISKQYRKKLLSFGFTKGITFEIVRVAPLGDPIEVKLRGFSVTLRKDELDGLIAVKVKDEFCATCSSSTSSGCHTK